MGIAEELSKNIRKCVEGFIDILGSSVAWLTLFITFVIVYEVIMRYFLRHPSEWVHYISAYCFAYLIMLGGGSVEKSGSNIRSDMIISRVSKRTRALLNSVSCLCLVIFCGVLLWSGWIAFWDSMITNRVQAGVLQWPLWPHLIVIPIGAVLVLLAGLIDFRKNLSIIFAGDLNKQDVSPESKE